MKVGLCVFLQDLRIAFALVVGQQDHVVALSHARVDFRQGLGAQSFGLVPQDEGVHEALRPAVEVERRAHCLVERRKLEGLLHVACNETKGFKWA